MGSDRSGTWGLGGVGISSVFVMAFGTDSSWELFLNDDANWSSDVSESKNSKRVGGSGEKERLGAGFGSIGRFDSQGIRSGYGSNLGGFSM